MCAGLLFVVPDEDKFASRLDNGRDLPLSTTLDGSLTARWTATHQRFLILRMGPVPGLRRQYGIRPLLTLQSLASSPLLEFSEIREPSIEREDLLFPSIGRLGRIGFAFRNQFLDPVLPLLTHAFGGLDSIQGLDGPVRVLLGPRLRLIVGRCEGGCIPVWG